MRRALRRHGASLALGAVAAATPAAAQERARPTVEFVQPWGPPSRPFSPAVRVGDLLFLAGQIGTAGPDATGPLVAGGIERETQQTMENIGAVLRSQGLTFADVVKCTVMLADMAEWDRMNAVYRTYFSPPRFPARSALGANGLALGARVEIECIAAVRR